MTNRDRSHQSHRRSGVGRGHLNACWWFWTWAVVGAVGMVGLVGLGPIALAPALLAGRAIAANRAARNSALGLPAGVGLVSLLIAYIQRQGPGTTCWHTARAGGCDQYLNPIPWLVAGVVLVVGAISLQAHRRR